MNRSKQSSEAAKQLKRSYYMAILAIAILALAIYVVIGFSRSLQ